MKIFVIMKTGCKITNKMLFFYLVVVLFYKYIYFDVFAFSQTKPILSHFENTPVSDDQKTNKGIKNAYQVSASTPKTQTLNAGQGNESAVWSNAFNFNKLSGTEIDPRTGILNAYVKVGSLLSNLGHGPDINLQINYNSVATADPDGLGWGWSWNLTHFNAATDKLTTTGGQTFYLQSSRKYHWQPLYHKLKDIRIDGDKSTCFTITYANGLREYLSHEGYITSLKQQDGRAVHFFYKHGTHLLTAITDDQGNDVHLVWKQGYLAVISRNSDGQPIAVRINNIHHHVNNVVLLTTDNRVAFPGINISYTKNLISNIEYPSGMKKTITYDCTGAVKISMQGNLPDYTLCVVSRESVNPRFGQPEMITRYQYSLTNNNEHNYLGYNSGLHLLLGMKKDIMFEAPVNYTYKTIKDSGLIREERTWNKYHLLTDIRLISNRTNHVLSEVQSFFCSTQQTDNCSHTHFKDLPATYSLPLKTVTRIWGDSTDIPATDIEVSAYDNQGRIISHTDAYGRISHMSYCSAKGDGASCPPTPSGWLRSTLPRSVTIFPVKNSHLSPITTDSYYRKLPNRYGKGYLLVLDHKTVHSGDQYMTISRHYYNDPDNALTYGLLKQAVLTGSLAQGDELRSIVRNYYYVKSADGHSEVSYNKVMLAPNKFQVSPAVTTSLFTHQLLQRTDALGTNITRYHYDRWGRLVQTDLAAGTFFATSVHYSYTLSHECNQVVVTSANGLQHKVIFDGLGRKLIRFNEAISITGKGEPGHWVPEEKTDYDIYGRIKQQISYTLDKNNNVTPFATVTKDYDDTGRTVCTHLPNGETAVTKYDDPDRCMVSYMESHSGSLSALSVVHANILNKPVIQQSFPASDIAFFDVKILCNLTANQIGTKTKTTFYDGFGRSVSTKDSMGREVAKRYDYLGRITDIINPKKDIVHQQHNLLGQVIHRWAMPVAGGKYLLFSAKYNADGQLLWKSGEDNNKTLFTYTPDGQPETITTQAGHVVHIKYNLLGLPVSKYLDGKLLQQVNYDPVTALPVVKNDITGITRLSYSIDGLPTLLVHTGKNNYPDYQLFWKYDRNRRLISHSDISGNQTLTSYDNLGRIAAINYQSADGVKEELSVPIYDDFSRTILIRYGSKMQRTIAYDSWGRKSQVTDKIRDTLLNRWNFSYDAEDNITTLIQQTEKNQQAVLNYHYDALDNLISMTCTGSAGLQLCPRDTVFTGSGLNKAPIIARQDYTFNSLNRLTQVKEILQNPTDRISLSKVVTYGYGNTAAPLRLQQISTRWDKESAVVNRFRYDIAGNMTTDGAGNRILYNAFNQVSRVISPDGQQSHYFYNGSGKEILEKTGPGNRYYLFYWGNRLLNEKINSAEQETHTIGYQGIARTIDNTIHEYYEKNYRGDIVGILTKSPENNAQYKLNQLDIYSPYGMRWHSMATSLLLYQQNLSGFDGERTDPVTGWQFLGEGHRTYNPGLRSFVSEDPAGDGYAFGSNNPIMNTDHSGNLPTWLNQTFKWMGYLGSLGMRAIPHRWASVVATAITGGLMTVLSCGIISNLPGLAIYGTPYMLSVSAAAVPSNRGLNIAASVTGIMETTFLVASSIALLGYHTAISIATYFATKAGISAANAMSEIPAEGNITEMFELASIRDSSSESPSEDNVVTLKDTLEKRFPHQVKTSAGKKLLSIATEEEVGEIWAHLIDVYSHKYVEEDVGAVLLATKITGKNLNIDKLHDLLDAKMVISVFDGGDGGHNYIDASYDLLSSLAKEIHAVDVNADEEMVDFCDICPEYGSAAIFQRDGHTAVLERLFGRGEDIRWKTTKFLPNGTMEYRQGDIDDVLIDFVLDGFTTNFVVDMYYKL